MKKIIPIIVLLFLLFPAAFLSKGFGENIQTGSVRSDIGVYIAPVKFLYDVSPGDTVGGTLDFYNANPGDLTLYLYTKNFVAGDQPGVPRFIDDPLPYTSSLKDWIIFDRSVFNIKKVTEQSSNVQRINFTIKIPENAEPGGHYAAMIATQNDPKKQLKPEDGNLAFQANPGAIVLLNIKGDVRRDLSLIKFDTVDIFRKDYPKQWLFEYMPVGFLTEISNTGNSHAFPKGNILIKQGDRDIANIQFNEEDSAILRESTRSYLEQWGDSFIYWEPVQEEINGKMQVKTDKNGNTVTRLAINWQNITKIYFGKYKAQLLLAYQDGEVSKPLVAEVEFWVIPWKIILVIIAIILLFVYVKIRLSRKKKKNTRRYD